MGSPPDASAAAPSALLLALAPASLRASLRGVASAPCSRSSCEKQSLNRRPRCCAHLRGYALRVAQRRPLRLQVGALEAVAGVDALRAKRVRQLRSLGLLLPKPCLRLQHPFQVPRRAPRRAVRRCSAAHVLPPPRRRIAAGEAQRHQLPARQRERRGALHSRALGACNAKAARCGERVASTRLRAHVARARVRLQRPAEANAADDCVPPGKRARDSR